MKDVKEGRKSDRPITPVHSQRERGTGPEFVFKSVFLHLHTALPPSRGFVVVVVVAVIPLLRSGSTLPSVATDTVQNIQSVGIYSSTKYSVGRDIQIQNIQSVGIYSSTIYSVSRDIFQYKIFSQ